MSTVIDKMVRDCRAGQNPRTICRVHSGWVVLGEAQFLSGYSLLLPDPVVPDLNTLKGRDRDIFLSELCLLGDALLELTASHRINYEILGNLEPALHAHAFPRYETEAEELKKLPVWSYDWASGPAFDLSRDQPLMLKIAKHLKDAGA